MYWHQRIMAVTIVVGLSLTWPMPLGLAQGGLPEGTVPPLGRGTEPREEGFTLDRAPALQTAPEEATTGGTAGDRTPDTAQPVEVQTAVPATEAVQTPTEQVEPRGDDDSVQVLKASLSKTEVVELTLDEALRRALENNPTLDVSQAQTRLSKAQYHTQLAGFLPDIQLEYYSQDYNGRIMIFGNEGIDIARNINQPSIIFRFPLFRGGRRFFQAQSAKRGFQAQQYVELTTQQQILEQTALAYYELQQRLDQIAVAQQQLRESQAQLAINQARLEAGVGTRLDVLQSKALVANARQNLVEATRAAQVAALRLNELLDLPAFMDVIPAVAEQEMRTLIPQPMTFDQMLKLAVENRPELRALVKQIQSLEALRKVAWTGALPDVDLQIQSGGIGPTLSDLRNFDNTTFSVTMTFRNLLVSTFTRLKENTAEIETILNRLESTENQIRREVSEAHLESVARLEQIEAIREEIAATELALSDALERLEVGIGRNIDVVQAETNLTRARTELAVAIMQYNQSQVRLVQALGLTSVDTLTKGITMP